MIERESTPIPISDSILASSFAFLDLPGAVAVSQGDSSSGENVFDHSGRSSCSTQPGSNISLRRRQYCNITNSSVRDQPIPSLYKYAKSIENVVQLNSITAGEKIMNSTLFQGRRAYSSSQILHHRVLRQKQFFCISGLNSRELQLVANGDNETNAELTIKRAEQLSKEAVSATMPYLICALIVTLKMDGLLDLFVNLCSRLSTKIPSLSKKPFMKAILSLKDDPIIERLKSERGIDYSINHVYDSKDDGERETFIYNLHVDDESVHSVWGHFTDVDAGSVSSLRDFLSWNPDCFNHDEHYVEKLVDISSECEFDNEMSNSNDEQVEKAQITLEIFFGLS